ncbi:MAG: alpha/beta hydrolase [Gemmobacter sp.]
MQFRSEADRAYANGAFIPGSDAYPARWTAEAAAFRASLGPRARLDLPYGAGARHRFDLFLPEGQARGLMVFVHGGYWMATGREVWSHLAAGAVARGWACAMPSYTLAPEARIGAMTQEVAAAVQAAAGLVAGPVVVTGHSAGGHLSARMGCADLDLTRVVRVVPISPLSELAPLMATEMNDKLRLDEGEAAAESPARLTPRQGVHAHVWVGGQERPAFLWQARLLSEAWRCPWSVDPGRHHFDVIEALTDPDSVLIAACLDAIRPPA